MTDIEIASRGRFSFYVYCLLVRPIMIKQYTWWPNFFICCIHHSTFEWIGLELYDLKLEESLINTPHPNKHTHRISRIPGTQTVNYPWLTNVDKVLQNTGFDNRTVLVHRNLGGKHKIAFSINGSWNNGSGSLSIKNATIADHVASLLLCQASHQPFLRLCRSGRLGCSVCFALFQGTRQCPHIWK